MKKVFIFLAVLWLIHFGCFAMIAKKVPATANPLKEKLHEAFQAFDLSAEQYSIHVHAPEHTPDADIDRWTVIGNQLEFINDITTPPTRFEFVAYWCAAYIKNNAFQKTELCYWGSLAAIIFGSTATSLLLMSQNSPNSCIAATGSLCAAILVTLGFDAPKRIQTGLEQLYVSRALNQACQKLIAQNKFEPIAAYYAFSQSMKRGLHNSENYGTIIEQSLAKAKHELVRIDRKNSLEVRIINPYISQNHQIASAFCSLPSTS
jgi:hypothetical protein